MVAKQSFTPEIPPRLVADRLELMHDYDVLTCEKGGVPTTQSVVLCILLHKATLRSTLSANIVIACLVKYINM